jgi:uncharacterized protein YbaR (Trm112 family)
MQSLNCPYCKTELERQWHEYYSPSKQRNTKQFLYYCPKHNKLFQNFRQGLFPVFPNHNIYINPTK